MKTLFNGLLKFLRVVLLLPFTVLWWAIKFALKPRWSTPNYNPHRAGAPGYDENGYRWRR